MQESSLCCRRHTLGPVLVCRHACVHGARYSSQCVTLPRVATLISSLRALLRYRPTKVLPVAEVRPVPPDHSTEIAAPPPAQPLPYSSSAESNVSRPVPRTTRMHQTYSRTRNQRPKSSKRIELLMTVVKSSKLMLLRASLQRSMRSRMPFLAFATMCEDTVC